MSVSIINYTIRATCSDIIDKIRTPLNWRSMTEEKLLYEAAVCICSSQVKFEHAEATVDYLCNNGLLQTCTDGKCINAYEKSIICALSDPIPIANDNSSPTWTRPRFKKRLGSLLASTVFGIYGQSQSIKSLLASTNSSKSAREVLIQNIWGFGPKQSSLFLRRIGFCADLAVLDVHVCDYLRLTTGLRLPPAKLSKLSFYEEVEDVFRVVSESFGYSLGCVDLATWLTMRVAKREAWL